MWVVALVLVVVIVGAVVVAVVRRPRGGDAHSVQSYNHALGTLEHLSERIGPPTVRPIARQVGTDAPAGTPELVVPPVPVRGTDEFPDPDAPIVFDDARPADRTRTVTTGDAGHTTRGDRAQRMALDSMNHRRRGGMGIAVAVLVVAVFAALAVLGSHKSHSAAHASTTTTRASGSAGTGTTTTTTRPKPTPTTRPTPTTLPTQLVATTTSSAGTSANYTVPNASFRITATGTGACWVEVDSAATGKAIWAGELSSGTVQTIQTSGATTVQFGTPTLTLAVDTIPVVLPTPLHTPFIATFTPSAAAVAAAAASPTSTVASGVVTTTTTP